MGTSTTSVLKLTKTFPKNVDEKDRTVRKSVLGKYVGNGIKGNYQTTLQLLPDTGAKIQRRRLRIMVFSDLWIRSMTNLAN